MRKLFIIIFLLTIFNSNANILNVQNFGAIPNDFKDDTQAFQNCANQLIKTSGGEMIIPAGRYQISSVKFFGKKYSNIKITGQNATIEQIFTQPRHVIERWNTYSRRNAADGVFIFDAQVSKQYDDRESIKNIIIKGLNFYTDNKKYGFDELSHQISAHGVSGFSVLNCTFTGFLGDGIAINAGTDFRENYGAYNKNVTIINSHFDGVTKNNRQGISFYYCDGFLVENCTFKNITRSDMPGAIDIEPMEDWQISRKGIIRNCSFENIGGIAAVLFFLFDQSKETPQKSSYGYVLENCTFKNVRAPLAVIGHDDFIKYNKAEKLVQFKNSIVEDFVRIMDARKAYGVLISNVKYKNVKLDYKTLFGNQNEGKNITFDSNSFENYLTDDVFKFSENSKNVQFNKSILKKK